MAEFIWKYIYNRIKKFIFLLLIFMNCYNCLGLNNSIESFKGLLAYPLSQKFFFAGKTCLVSVLLEKWFSQWQNATTNLIGKTISITLDRLSSGRVGLFVFFCVFFVLVANQYWSVCKVSLLKSYIFPSFFPSIF